jgi:GT2 family glycosyltransferase
VDDPSPPLLSIVTPCRNAAGFLPRALESVAREAARAPAGAIEHIIMDGASSDGSVEIIRRHALANPQLVVHWCSHPDGGQSEAINRGMCIARGRYATWLNADDQYEAGGLAAVVEHLGASQADVLVGRCRWMDEGGRTVGEPRPPEPIALASLLKLRSLWFNGRLLVQPEVFFRRELFRSLGGLNTANHYTMDHELWCRMLLAGASFETIDVPVAALCLHEGQKTRDNREVVRTMLSYCLPLLESAQQVLRAESVQVKVELAGLARKLEMADAAIRWWQGALARPGLERLPLRPEDQPLPPGDGEQVARRALATAARALRWRRGLRIGLFECHPHLAARVARMVGGWRRVEMHIASASRLAVAQASAAMRPLLSSRSSIAGHHGLLVAGPLDMVITQGISVRTTAPVSVLGDLWSRLGPGGVLVQLDDPYRSAELVGYVEALCRRVSDFVTRDHDMLLDHEADGFVRRIAALPPPPAVAGLDPARIVPRLTPARCLLLQPYGAAQDHPLTPFPPVLPVAFGSWVSSVWRRE